MVLDASSPIFNLFNLCCLNFLFKYRMRVWASGCRMSRLTEAINSLRANLVDKVASTLHGTFSSQALQCFFFMS